MLTNREEKHHIVHKKPLKKKNDGVCRKNFAILKAKKQRKYARVQITVPSITPIVTAEEKSETALITQFFDSLLDPIRAFVDQNKDKIDENNLASILEVVKSPLVREQLVLDYAKSITNFKNLHKILTKINIPAMALNLVNQCDDIITKTDELIIVLPFLSMADRILCVEKHLNKICSLGELTGVALLLNPIDNIQLLAKKKTLVRINSKNFSDAFKLAWCLPPREAYLFIVEYKDKFFEYMYRYEPDMFVMLFDSLLAKADCSESEYYSLLKNYLQYGYMIDCHDVMRCIDKTHILEIAKVISTVASATAPLREVWGCIQPLLKEIPQESRREFWEHFFNASPIIDTSFFVHLVFGPLLRYLIKKEHARHVFDNDFIVIVEEVAKKMGKPDLDYVETLLKYLCDFPPTIKINCLRILYPVLHEEALWRMSAILDKNYYEFLESKMSHVGLSEYKCYFQQRDNNKIQCIFLDKAGQIEIINFRFEENPYNNFKDLVNINWPQLVPQIEKLNDSIFCQTYNLDLAKKYLTTSTSLLPSEALKIFAIFIRNHFFNATEYLPAFQHLLSIKQYTDEQRELFEPIAKEMLTKLKLENATGDEQYTNIAAVSQRVRAMYLEKMDACINALDMLKNVPNELKNIILQYYDDNFDLSGLTHHGIQFSPKLMPTVSMRFFQPAETSQLQKEENTSSISKKL